MPQRSCDLCEAARLTEWHHEDEVCWVADCELCAVPMVVWRSHGTSPPETEVVHMRAVLERVTAARFADFYVDDVRRNIPDHWHAHGRPRGSAALRWWAARMRS